MKRASVFVLSAGMAWGGIGGGVSGIKVGLGKNPPGNLQLMAATDPGGSVRLRVPEAGRYVIHFEQPAALPFWVNVNGEVRGMGQQPAPGSRPLATGRMFPEGGPLGARVAIPGIPFNAQTRVFREEVEFNGPAEMILRLTEGQPIQPQPCPPGMRPPCPAVSTNHGEPGPVIHFRPRQPLALQRGRSYMAVDRRTQRVVSRFRLNQDGTVTAQMVEKAEGEKDKGSGGCKICKDGKCVELPLLEPDKYSFPNMEVEDASFPGFKSPNGAGQGAPGGNNNQAGGDSSCSGGEIISVAWPSVTTRPGQATNN